jgi:hypothetical protein
MLGTNVKQRGVAGLRSHAITCECMRMRQIVQIVRYRTANRGHKARISSNFEVACFIGYPLLLRPGIYGSTTGVLRECYTSTTRVLRQIYGTSTADLRNIYGGSTEHLQRIYATSTAHLRKIAFAERPWCPFVTLWIPVNFRVFVF